MRTVLWVLMESLRHVGTCSIPVTPTIADALLDQLAVPTEGRTFAALEAFAGFEIEGGRPLPEPAVIVPRYEPPEGAAEAEAAVAAAKSAAAAPPALEGAALTALEEEVREAGDAVRLLKEGGGSKEAVGEAVEALLALKAKLPEGHELKGGKKKKKKKA